MTEFDPSINAYLEANQEHAKELFSIARQHRLTYMALNAQAMEIFKPVLEWYTQRNLFNECIEYLYQNIPNCFERTLYIQKVYRMQDSFTRETEK